MSGDDDTMMLDEPDDKDDESYRDPVSSSDDGDRDVFNHDGLDETDSVTQTSTSFEIRLPKVKNRDDYITFPKEFCVSTILEQVQNGRHKYYQVRFEDNHISNVSFETLLNLDNGPKAYSLFDTEPAQNNQKNNQHQSNQNNSSSLLFFDPGNIASDEDLVVSDLISPAARPPSDTITTSSTLPQHGKTSEKRPIELSSDGETIHTLSKRPRQSAEGSEKSRSQSPAGIGQRRSRRLVQRRIVPVLSLEQSDSDDGSAAEQTQRITRSSGNKVKHISLSYKVKQPDEETDTDSSGELVVSDLLPHQPARKRKHSQRVRKGQDIPSEDVRHRTTQGRRSGRTMHRKNEYRIPDVDDGFEREEQPILVKPKTRTVHAQENFPMYNDDDEFLLCHSDICDSCRQNNDTDKKGPLVYCQGCSLSYHKACIARRPAREHLVTKVAEDTHVLQCRRCIGKHRLKDKTAPRTDWCTSCKVQGLSCVPFSSLKSTNPKRDSEATTPEAEVLPELLNNADNVMLRCQRCMRGWHFEHLPSRNITNGQSEGSPRKEKKKLYSCSWVCLDCFEAPEKIQNIVAWRPADQSTWDPEVEVEDFGEDEREYLVKFEDKSYFQCRWMPGPWVWGLVAHPMRSTFAKKNPLPKQTMEEAVDPEFLRIEIVLDLTYTSFVPVGKEVEVDLARVKEVSKALVKYRGLTYDDVVWESPPSPESGELWADFKRAYEDWVHGQYIHLPYRGTNQKRIERVRSLDFTTLEKKTQPKYIEGGTLMDYQKEGMNWLYYKWWKGENAILADEMGLGKTIQIISFLSIIFHEHKIWPFLIIVPHSTVPNWKREIQRWNPNLRVVAYPGSEKARKLTRKYEMFHPSGRELKCHIVVASYQTLCDDPATLKAIPWEVMIIDEGQRLKNDSSLLYGILSTFKTKHKVLLTGTPLQNNPRELFNLLQFLNPDEMKADQLEQKFGELTKENVPELHNMIRPYFLRRTKAQVLTMLPPMAEIIVPVTMTSLQTKLYKSILLKDAELIKSILSKGNRIKKTERARLGNILMQLRIVLCHPFVYNYEIEENVDDPDIKFRNLTDASAKLQLLEIMLPKLKERGHRVLLFSQFLGMLDIIGEFLEGLCMTYTRLDGGVSSIERQKRIDAYNAPNSELFAFLLSTRAGGIGINLATADTVIILDPDYNPHQDLQALSRAHRIGQTRKVLVFHLMTRDTAEEKIIQLGKKKLSLDHLIIEQMGANEDQEVDVESILKFGAASLFDDTNEKKAIRYDPASVGALLDRSQVEATIGDNKEASAETAFSFARVWVNDSANLESNLHEDREDDIPTEAWERILKEREEQDKKEREARALEGQLGRGKRTKFVQSYINQDVEQENSGDDTDFMAPEEHEESDDEEFRLDDEDYNQIIPHQLQQQQRRSKSQLLGPDSAIFPPPKRQRLEEYQMAPYPPGFENQQVPQFPSLPPMGFFNPPFSIMENRAPYPPGFPLPKTAFNSTQHITNPAPKLPPQVIPPRAIPSQALRPPAEKRRCLACKNDHTPGKCPLKLMGVEYCPLCGIAHFGKGPVCPHLGSETQLKAMLAALRESNEDPGLIALAKKYIHGRLGQVRKEKRERERLGIQRVVGTNEQYTSHADKEVIELI